MELTKINGPVSVVGGGETTDFGIKNNSKMFRILSDNLYQDKIGSIVREVSCNAVDSHMAAGTPEKPFIIHIPDAFEPWFTVRDFGVGLSPESVKTVFCQYGESTKDDSNDSIGAFGLGAKTPFAYTDQFTVVSNYNGKMYAYNAFISASGKPQLVLMAETDTDEHNGVEIKLGVKPEDFKRFAQAIRTQLRFFPVKPLTENYEGEFAFDTESEALFESKSIKIFKNNSHGARVNIVQGPVGYPLDFNQINPHLSVEDSKFLRTICEVGGNLFFNIGEIGVTASREGVEYNSYTINSLKTRIALAHKEVIDWISTQIATLPNVYEKVMFVNDNQTFRSIINGVKMDLSPAIKDTTGKYSFSIGTCPAFKVEMTTEDAAGVQTKKLVSGISITEYTRNSMNGFTGSRNSAGDAALHPNKNNRTTIVIRDTNKTPVLKMRHYFKENGLEKMYALSPIYDSIKFDNKFIKELSAHLGGFVDIVLVSTMPEPPKTAYDRSQNAYSRPSAYMAKANGQDDMDSVANWDRVYDKLEELTDDSGDSIERAVYITVERQRTETINYEAKRLYNELCRAQVVKIPLYGIRVNDLDKLKETDIEWIKLEDYVNEKKVEIAANPNIKRHSIAKLIDETVQQNIGTRFSDLKGLDKRTALARLIRVGEKAKKMVAKSKINHHMLRIAGYDAEKHPAVTAVRNAGKNVFNLIPMVKYVSRGGYSTIQPDEMKHVVEYINHFGVKR